ncbi:hypothetical protein BUALT_Bualt14G0093700 [Buddleja alternifolia]|uniref:SMP domain-containing protein n=1 Tax=Buddleja alternifolia TaxID=168488 RepID=A0AAV6WI28_9LAMI|nr:hypothetical protein BUALT_Bualt14G0093700 [Buddleja alternifolia]
MSQEQPRRPQEEEEQRQEPIKYGDVFEVPGELTKEPIAPGDAALMQAAEASVLGQTIQGGPASAMQAAATMNVRAGLVGEGDVSDVTREQGVTVMETDYPGGRIITEAVGEQVIGQYMQAKTAEQATITIGEALEASGRVAGDRPIDQSDAAAIQAAECMATGTNMISPGGLAATALAAAAYNAALPGDEGKVKLATILAGAPAKMAADKEATQEDAEKIMREELRNDPKLQTTHPGGVAEAVATAARMNERAP